MSESVDLHIRVPKPFLEALKAEALRQDISVSKLVRRRLVSDRQPPLVTTATTSVGLGDTFTVWDSTEEK